MKLDGTSVVITGSFSGYGDGELQKALEERGATVVGMSPAVELVVAGDEPGTEYDEARELGIRVVESDGLEALLEGRELKPATTTAAPPAEPTDVPEPPAGLTGPAGAAAAAAEAEKAKGDDDGERTFEKGARVKIVSGLEGVGVVGEIFWWGESKFGDGMRAGVSPDDEDETYWVDEEHLGWPDEDIPEEVMEAAEQASVFSKGDRVRVTSGKHEGATGVIFWWGESKWGDGMRAGINTDDDDTAWVDAEHLESAEPDEADDPIPF